MTSRPCRRLTPALLLLAALAGRASAQAVNVDRAGVALEGYDVVAYHTEQRAVRGVAAHAATHEGATYRFATREHRDRFVADPGRWLPRYGGYCAYGVSRGYKVGVDPEAFSIVDGALYLNYSKSVRKTWLTDVAGYVARAEANWPGLVGR
jgi:YHS domain-containing protein